MRIALKGRMQAVRLSLLLSFPDPLQELCCSSFLQTERVDRFDIDLNPQSSIPLFLCVPSTGLWSCLRLSYL
ncbi:hypothetical protein BJ165DRAFT_1503425 [Panaeolus papilionaceus]|nr:hypothetical protein BJ165DRAFT_1503425 [Panaeolus papilionaceus]